MGVGGAERPTWPSLWKSGAWRAVEQDWGASRSRCSCSVIPCAAAVGFGSASGVEIPASGASLKLDAGPITHGEEGNEKQRSWVVFFLSLINSGSLLPAFCFSASPAISGRVNWGQGSGKASGNSWGQCPEGSATPSPPWPSGPSLPPFSRAAQKPAGRSQ